MNEGVSLDVQEALLELERYYSDELAPLVVTSAVDILLGLPPSVAATGILEWTAGQTSRGSQGSISDYYYHALKKLHLMAEFKLVPPEQLKEYLKEVANLVVETAPPEEQDGLRGSIARLGEVKQSINAKVNLVSRPEDMPQGLAHGSGPAVGGAKGFSDEALRGVRRFSLLLERLRRDAETAMAAGPATTRSASQEALLSQILTTAATSSHSADDLSQFLARLREMGLEAQVHEIFQALSHNLPAWFMPGAPTNPGAGAPIDAMHKMVSMARDPAEKATRFSELIRVSIERFNDGELAQAAQMFDVAEKLIAEKKVDPAVAQRIRDTAHEKLSEERLGEYADKTESHVLLQRVLDFFPPMAPRSLFEALGDEAKRERRRLLIALLEVHGLPARTVALEILSTRGDEVHFFLLRNLLHILRRIPRPADLPLDEELALLSVYSRSANEPMVVREAIAVLGQMKDARSESLLIERLGDFERALLAGKGTLEPNEGRSTLERIVAALARREGSTPIRSVVEHGLSRQAALGDTIARLADLAARDLSVDVQSLQRLLTALEAELPSKVFGIVVPRNHHAAIQIMKALSGTPSRAVRSALEEVAKRYPEGDLGEEATKALAWLGAPVRTQEPAAATLLSGDIGLFALPNLMQSLADADITGTVVLADPAGGLFGTILMDSGRVRDCQVGLLRGDQAFYQLFEKPVTGSFTVKARQATPVEEEAKPASEVMPLLMEAMRRQDEYRSACVVVPDDFAFTLTGAKPTRPQDENDPDLLKSLWGKVREGAMAAQCEVGATVDSYRVRRILAHWLEEGAIQPRKS